jgi:hypothetical protein
LGRSVPQPHTRLCELLVPLHGQNRANTQKAHCSSFASACVPLSDEKRDGDRSFSATRGKANSVSPLPARIAPPRWGNAQAVDAIVPCPPQEESHSGNLSGRPTSPGPGTSPILTPLRGFPTPPMPKTHHRRCSCEPFKDSKKTRGRQRRRMGEMRWIREFWKRPSEFDKSVRIFRTRNRE